MPTATKPKFNAGVLLATPGASEAFERNDQMPFGLLQRHLNGDWGELCDEDRQANDQALIDGSRFLSAYRLKDGTKVWASPRLWARTGNVRLLLFCSPRIIDWTNRQPRDTHDAHRPGSPNAVSQLLPVLRLWHQVDRRVGLCLQRPLSEVQQRDRAIRLGRNLAAWINDNFTS